MSIEELFQKMKSTRMPSGKPEYLIAGLGNPGKAYEQTRHNAGFMAIDALAGALDTKINRAKFDALCGDAGIGGKPVLLIKPQTYMNASGIAVSAAAEYYKIPPEHVIVLFDDISLEPGKVRIRRKGSHGGHNGIRSIVDYLQSEAFPRVKIGVGERPNPNYDLADWVLSTFKEDEKKAIREVASHCREIVELMLSGNVDKAMNLYNS